MIKKVDLDALKVGEGVEAHWALLYVRNLGNNSNGTIGLALIVADCALGVQSGVLPGSKGAAAENALVCECEHVEEVACTVRKSDMC